MHANQRKIWDNGQQLQVFFLMMAWWPWIKAKWNILSHFLLNGRSILMLFCFSFSEKGRKEPNTMFTYRSLVKQLRFATLLLVGIFGRKTHPFKTLLLGTSSCHFIRVVLTAIFSRQIQGVIYTVLGKHTFTTFPASPLGVLGTPSMPGKRSLKFP